VRLAELRASPPQTLEKFHEAAALADRHYRLGAVPLGTYVELQDRYLDAVEAFVSTQAEAIAAGLKLEELTGLDLGLGEGKQ
jgi:cobalt-zinc-cadmium efflux system outer membrane protein